MGMLDIQTVDHKLTRTLRNLQNVPTKIAISKILTFLNPMRKTSNKSS